MKPEFIAALVLLTVAGAALMLRRSVPEAGQGAGLVPDWLSFANIAEETGALFGGAAVGPQAAANVAAFLAMIRHAEGTANAPDPYRVLFGGAQWAGSMADHPRQAKQFRNKKGELLWTSAAGAYQFMAASPLPNGSGKWTKVDTWTTVRDRLGLPDFGPASQDRAAVELIDEAGALADVQAGRFSVAVGKVRRIWASLPGAGHDQPERSLQWALDRYTAAGGALA